jgi:hypothetical protein
VINRRELFVGAFAALVLRMAERSLPAAEAGKAAYYNCYLAFDIEVGDATVVTVRDNGNNVIGRLTLPEGAHRVTVPLQDALKRGYRIEASTEVTFRSFHTTSPSRYTPWGAEAPYLAAVDQDGRGWEVL